MTVLIERVEALKHARSILVTKSAGLFGVGNVESVLGVRKRLAFDLVFLAEFILGEEESDEDEPVMMSWTDEAQLLGSTPTPGGSARSI